MRADDVKCACWRFGGGVDASSAAPRRRWVLSASGMTLIELVLGIAVASILVGIGLPVIKNVLASYNLSAAVSAVSGAIQSTRYQAIATGCPYAIAFDPATTTYQVSYEALSGAPPACAPSFSSLGGAIPWSDAGGISVSAATTLQFSANGSITATVGSMAFSLTNGTQTETITVSGVGNVTVSP
jgi:prepilin-type N-terminal cleavage/methylation domain-containing protein